MFIEFESVFNARDLGGLPAADGRRVKPGLLLRTAKLNTLTDADAQRLEQEFHLRHIFDFRDGSEVAVRPDRSIPGAQLHALPVLPELPGNNNDDYLRLSPERVLELMRGIYRTMAREEKSTAAYRAFFHTLLAHPGEAVLWHCTQGKDRTGIAALLLLTALGVEESVCVEEYFLTNIPMGEQLERLRAMEKSAHELAVMERLLLVYPECLNEYLDSIKALDGSLMGYLRGRLGLTETDIQTLRDHYTE